MFNSTNQLTIKFKNGYGVSAIIKTAELMEIELIDVKCRQFMDMREFISTGEMIGDRGYECLVNSDEFADLLSKVSKYTRKGEK